MIQDILDGGQNGPSLSANCNRDGSKPNLISCAIHQIGFHIWPTAIFESIADVNGGQLMDMMEFLKKPSTIGLGYGRIIVFLNMHFISFRAHIDFNISIRW